MPGNSGLLFFITWIIHMIVLETSSYEELLGHLKIIVAEFYCETESPVNSSNLHPRQESQKITFCLYTCMGKKPWYVTGTGKNLFVFNLTYLTLNLSYVTLYVQVLYKSSRDLHSAKLTWPVKKSTIIRCLICVCSRNWNLFSPNIYLMPHFYRTHL